MDGDDYTQYEIRRKNLNLIRDVLFNDNASALARALDIRPPYMSRLSVPLDMASNKKLSDKTIQKFSAQLHIDEQMMMQPLTKEILRQEREENALLRDVIERSLPPSRPSTSQLEFTVVTKIELSDSQVDKFMADAGLTREAVDMDKLTSALSRLATEVYNAK